MEIGVQQIMLGKVCKNELVTQEIFKQIRNKGYTGIELNSFMIHKTNIFVRLLTSIAGMPVGKGGNFDFETLLKNADLKVIALHIDLDSLEKKTMEVIKDAKRFNTSKVVITGMYNYDYSSKEELEKLCSRLNKMGEVLLQNDLSLLYHNHNVEWTNLENGEKAFDYLINNLNSNFVNFEFDSYWASEAGVDIYSLMEKLGTRIKLWHINDRGTKRKGKSITPIISSDSMELGTGNLNLDLLISIAKKYQYEGIILETHRNFINNNPIDSINKSADFLIKRI